MKPLTAYCPDSATRNAAVDHAIEILRRASEFQKMTTSTASLSKRALSFGVVGGVFDRVRSDLIDHEVDHFLHLV